ncbi:MAG TPA: energy-coupling factor transporter transmembrane protein EcfT, partial [Clostridia bacterium]|nr:energy-coupling factor transporter transmembrane protein EcfT [Clostridia bacterium]
MLKDITIGQYFPGDTVIHKIDPRIKILTIGLFIGSLFFINSFSPYIFIVA